LRYGEHHPDCPEGGNGAEEMDAEQLAAEAGRSGRDDHEMDIRSQNEGV